MKYSPNLDGLRAYAALLVIAFHWEHLIPFGWIGVQMFFVLSGFLISGILIEKKQSGISLASYLPTFFRRRALRLFPLYFFFVLCIFISWTVSTVSRDHAIAAPFLVTYTINIWKCLPINTYGFPFAHLWSLASEWQFYLVWPFIVWRSDARNLKRLCVGLIITIPIVRLLTFYLANQFSPDSNIDPGQMYAYGCVYFSPLSHLDAFALGATLALPEFRNIFSKQSIKLLVLSLLGIGCLVTLYIGRSNGTAGFSSLGLPFYLRNGFGFVWGYTILNLSFAILILMLIGSDQAATKDRDPLRFIFGNRAIVFLGTISYGIYVWHMVVLQVLKPYVFEVLAINPKSLASIVWLAIAAFISIGTATLSYFLIERPFLLMKSKPRRPNSG